MIKSACKVVRSNQLALRNAPVAFRTFSVTTTVNAAQDKPIKPVVTTVQIPVNNDPVIAKPPLPPSVRIAVPPVTPEPKSAPPVVPPPPAPKKKTSLFGLLFKTLALVAVVYGGTLYVATKNDKVMDFVLDNELPYSDEIMDFIEKGSWDDIVDEYESLKSKLLNMELQSSKKLESFTTKLEQKTEELVEETKKKFEGKHSHDSSNITPEQQLQRPVEVEVITQQVKRLPLLSLPKDIDPSIKSTIHSFNELISKIDGSNIDGKIVKQINDNIAELSLKLNALTREFNAEVDNKLKVNHTELLASFTKKELDLTENLLHQYTEEKAQLEKKLKETLHQEIQATKETISQAAANAVAMVRIEQTKQFEQMVTEKIDNERNGRLKNLQAVNERLEDIEKFATSLENQLTANHQKLLIHKSLNKLKSLIFNYPENETPKLLAPYVNDLIKLSNEANDELIEQALKNLVPLVSKDSTHSVLTNEQLLTRWELLVPELRSASLLPPNAGLLGHLASTIFSKLLLPVKGNKPDGKDIESVIGRVESSLIKGQLDNAVEEVSNLKGWPRKLADDWVQEGRKKLEIEFLISLIDAESKTL